MKAVIYARYSSDSQREESIEGQLRECTEYAERNGITILRSYIDRALSARTADRPEFQNMIKDSEQKLFDVVLATSMLQVGVDVQRLGMMLVVGQPKNTAEYIQASSRVGRGIPGLVFTLYNFGRPRDLSHFEHFCVYHSALYRSVEATSVTPWAPRARDKALHAVVASLVRHQVTGMQGDDEAGRFDPADPAVIRILDFIRARVLSATDEAVAEDATDELNAIVGEWATRSADVRSGTGILKYWGRKSPFGRTVPHLMQAAEETSRGGPYAWPTPNSMREVEPSTAFVLKTIPRRVEAD